MTFRITSTVLSEMLSCACQPANCLVCCCLLVFMNVSAKLGVVLLRLFFSLFKYTASYRTVILHYCKTNHGIVRHLE